MRPLLSALFALLLLGLTVPASATDWPAVETRLKKAVASPAFVDAVLDQYRLQGSTRAAMRTHLTALYRSDEVIKALVREMRHAGIDKDDEVLNGNALQVGRRFGAELFQSWAIKGLARLPAADQRQFYRFILQWMNVAGADDCKRLMFSDDQSAVDNGRLEMKYYPRMAQGELEAYFALLRKAVLAELRDFPSAKSLNREQLDIADKAFEARLEELIRRGDTPVETLLAMAEPSKAGAPAACEAGKLIFRTLLDMKGFAGDLMVLKMVLSAQ
jgi:hypothetical protein